MICDQGIPSEIRVGFLLRSHLPPNVVLLWLIPPTFAISFVCGFSFFSPLIMEEDCF